ncbi:MAG TPA: ATP synthase F0 subunit B [Kofleriaceae bacterium]|nr:ATP synthase F0 subunit B [Kofleriaceae bacterium]
MLSSKKLFAALVLGLSLVAGQAVAQPAEQGGEGPTDKPSASATKEAAGDDIKREGEGKDKEEGHEAHHDPSRHFNFLGSPGEHYGKDEYGGKYGDGQMVDPHTGEVVMDEHGKPAEEEPMSAPFIFMVLNFAVLLGLLAWKGRPAIQKLAADRHDQIKTALDEAARLRQQAADKLAEYESRLKDADSEITKMVAGMRADAEADKQRILETAARQAEQMKRDAELRIAAEIEAARASLTREVTLAATAATEKLLREKMMPGDQQKLVTTFIGDLQTAARKEAR